MIAKIPNDELERLQAVREFNILDVPAQSIFDDAASLVSQICGTPIAGVSLIEADKQIFRSIVGIDVHETSRDSAFCAHTILGTVPMVVNDSILDDRFFDNPLVTGDPGIRFYAGAPLITFDGHAVGSVCAIDVKPRQMTEGQLNALQIVARRVVGALEMRRLVEREKSHAEKNRDVQAVLINNASLFQATINSVRDGIVVQNSRGEIILCNENAQEILGLTEEQLLGRTSVDPRWRSVDEQLDELPGEMHPAQLTLRDGQPRLDFQMGIHTPDEELKWLSVDSSLLELESAEGSDSVRFAVVTFRDVTAKKQQDLMMARLAGIVESSGDSIYTMTLDGTITSWNPGAEHLYGYASAEMIGRLCKDILPSKESVAELRRLFKLLESGESVPTMNARRVAKDGSLIDVSLQLSAVRDRQGRLVAISATERDIREQQRLLGELQRNKEMLADAQSLSGLGCWETDLRTGACKSSPEMQAIYGLPLSSVPRKPSVYHEIIHPDDREEAVVRFNEAKKTGAGYECDRRLVWPDGSIRHVHVKTRVKTEHGQPVSMYGSIHDITDIKRVEEELANRMETISDYAVALEFQKKQLEAANKVLAELSTQDGLTALANHRSFQERLHEEFARARRYNLPLSLILLDVDKFKDFNDSFGHPAGDEVLRQVATLMRNSSRDTDLPARYGGEEFAIILPSTNAEGAQELAERLRAQIAGFDWELRPVTASIGVCSMKPAQKDHKELIVAVDSALYESKHGGRNRVTAV